MTNYDDTTAFLGQWGRFQLITFFLLCAAYVPNGITIFSIVFVADTPNHHCLIPEVNLTQDWRNATIPKEVIKCLNTVLERRKKKELERKSLATLSVISFNLTLLEKCNYISLQSNSYNPVDILCA